MSTAEGPVYPAPGAIGPGAKSGETAASRFTLRFRDSRTREGRLTLFFLVALGSAWLAVLLPAAMRARRTTPLSSAQRFKKGMQLIAPPPATSSGRWIVSPRAGTRIGESRRRALEQRKRIFEALIGVVVGSFALAVFKGEGMWDLHLAADGVLFSYAVLLVGLKRRRLEAGVKIRPLPRDRQDSLETFSFNEPIEAGGSGR